jgi:hypothetical protein
MLTHCSFAYEAQITFATFHLTFSATKNTQFGQGMKKT